MHQELTVRFAYPVCFTEALFAPDNPTLADVVADKDDRRGQQRLLTVIDDGVLAHHPGLPDEIVAYCTRHQGGLTPVAAPIVLPGGEGVKSDDEHVHTIHAAIERHHIDRHSYVMAIGGGAVLDVVGYAAAVAHRGIRLLRVPTTVLCQNDAAVGVKNGVNAFGKKNFLGTFAPPWAVLCDKRFLATLPDREWRAGTSEAVKVALLKDPAFFEFLEGCATDLRDRDPEPMWELVQRCAELHLEHIATGGDPFELGSSRPLDFGHWSAHRLEGLSDFSISHGEAVAIGMAIDCTYARLAGLLDDATWLRILDVLRRLGLPLYRHELGIVGPDGRPAVLDGLHEFREHLGGQLTITLVTGIGSPVDVHEIDEDLMVRSIRRLAAGLPGCVHGAAS